MGIIPWGTQNESDRLEELSAKISEVSSEAGIPLSVSIGYVDVRMADNILDIPAIVGLADKALYQAKTSGRGVINEYRR